MILHPISILGGKNQSIVLSLNTHNLLEHKFQKMPTTKQPEFVIFSFLC